MYVRRLGLEDFRNYRRAEIGFAPEVNLVVGSNAQGKTNLLEAVYCLGGLGSPRGPDANLVRDGADRALLHAGVARGRELRVDLEVRPGRGTRALLNGSPLPATRALSEVFTCVFFGPDELQIVKGSPEGRRRFVDDLVVKLRPARHVVRREWDRVVRQRNALLRSARPGRGGDGASVRATLDVWDETLARVGAALTAGRLQALAQLAPYVAKRFEAIAGGGRMELFYASEWLESSVAALDRDVPVDEPALRRALAEAVAELRAREIERGMSLVGPGRDDVAVRLASPTGDSGLLDARSFASQGDQRTAALALKLAEHDLLTESLGSPPVLLLDDVFSELDPVRRVWLGEAIRGIGQTVVSSAEPGLEAVEVDQTIEIRRGTVAAVG